MALVLLLGTFAVGVGPAAATHFRGGNMSWQVDPTYDVPGRARIVIAYDSTWRWSFAYPGGGYPSVGATIPGPAGAVSVVTAGGQSATYAPQLTVLSTDPIYDSFLGRSQLILDYALSDFPLTVENSGGNRLSTLEEGNRDAAWRLRMVIPRPDASQASSPTLSVPFPHKIVLLVNSPATILLPELAGAGVPNVVEFSTAAESSLSGNIRPVGETAGFCPSQGGCPTCNTSDAGPCANAMKISPEGVLTWTPQRTGLFAVQVATKSGDGTPVASARAPLDLLLDVRQANGCFDQFVQPVPCAPMIPTLTVAPTSDAVEELPQLIASATVSAGTNVTILNTTPPGSRTTHSSPSPAATLTWTPAWGDRGTYEVCFQAITDAGFLSTVQCTTITVAPSPVCREGTFSATGNAPCTPCPYGTFADGLGQTACTTCTPGTTTPPFLPNCPFEHWYREVCTATDDQICVRCDSACGSDGYCSGPDASDCIPSADACPRATYSATGAKPCTWCPAGSHTEYLAQTSCEPCAPGTYAPGVGYHTCLACLGATFARRPRAGELHAVHQQLPCRPAPVRILYADDGQDLRPLHDQLPRRPVPVGILHGDDGPDLHAVHDQLPHGRVPVGHLHRDLGRHDLHCVYDELPSRSVPVGILHRDLGRDLHRVYDELPRRRVSVGILHGDRRCDLRGV